jgi:superfamily II DNA or RNA helicase
MLRPYQSSLKAKIFQKWDEGQRNVMGVMPTGAGKTVTMADLCAEVDEPSLAIAHRQELVSQISLAFARQGIKHRIIAPAAVVKSIIEQHVDEVGANHVHPGAKTAVAGVDTLIKREDPFFDTVRFWQTDEAHHVLATNKWGAAVGMLKAAVRGVGWTATPCRTDKKALRAGKGGVFHDLVVGPTMRELIDAGFLADFRIYSLPQSVDVSGVHVTSGGEFNGQELREAVHKSAITGDIVTHYMRLAAGKSGVTFAVDVAMAEEHARAFKEAGISAAVLHAKTPSAERIKIIKAFRNKELLQIVNVDVLGEGLLPSFPLLTFESWTKTW